MPNSTPITTPSHLNGQPGRWVFGWCPQLRGTRLVCWAAECSATLHLGGVGVVQPAHQGRIGNLHLQVAARGACMATAGDARGVHAGHDSSSRLYTVRRRPGLMSRAKTGAFSRREAGLC